MITIKQLYVEDLEKKIESHALRLSNLKPGFDRQEEEYYQSEKVKIYDLVKQVIKSDLAKEYWQQGMYSEEDMIDFGKFCKDYNSSSSTYNLHKWLDQNKKEIMFRVSESWNE